MRAIRHSHSSANTGGKVWETIPGLGMCVDGVPMHLLTKRGLTEAFIGVVEDHKRSGRSVVTANKATGKCELVPAVDLGDEVREARQRVVELSIEIDRLRAEYFARLEAESARSTSGATTVC